MSCFIEASGISVSSGPDANAVLLKTAAVNIESVNAENFFILFRVCLCKCIIQRRERQKYCINYASLRH